MKVNGKYEAKLADDLERCSACGRVPPRLTVRFMVLCGYQPCQHQRHAICWRCIETHYALHELAQDYMQRKSAIMDHENMRKPSGPWGFGV